MDGRKKGISLGSALLIVLLIVLWRVGTFDQALVNVGLNAKPCIRNGFGATFCGTSATSYCENLSSYGVQGGGCNEIPAATTTETPVVTPAEEEEPPPESQENEESESAAHEPATAKPQTDPLPVTR